MNREHRSITFARLVTIAVAPFAFACGDDPPVGFARVYTGELTGSDVRVGIVATDQRARLFFCGGASTFGSMTRWITADVDVAHQLKIPADAAPTWGLHGQVGDTEIMGSIDVGDGAAHPFRATVVSERTIGGLYEGTAPCGRLGLVVLQANPDAPATAQGVCIGEAIWPLSPFDPVVRDADGAIRVKVGTSDVERQVRPAAPPPK